jgi:hypothetical protein
MRHIHGLQNHQRPDDFHKKTDRFLLELKKQNLKNTKIGKTEW